MSQKPTNYQRLVVGFSWIVFGFIFGLIIGPFLAETASSDPQALLAGFTWLKHSGFRVESGPVVVYFDPWQISKATHDGDLIFVSHPHSDHCDPTSVRNLLKAGGRVITEPESANNLKSVAPNITIIKPGDEIEENGIKILGVPAYNVNKSNHPKSKNWLGFIVTLPDGRRIYHAGDTDLIPEMSTFKVDVAMLPIGGTYTMTATEAAEAAKQIQPQVALPMHYGSIVGTAADADKFQQLMDGMVPVIILKVGVAIPSTVSDWKQQK